MSACVPTLVLGHGAHISLSERGEHVSRVAGRADLLLIVIAFLVEGGSGGV